MAERLTGLIPALRFGLVGSVRARRDDETMSTLCLPARSVSKGPFVPPSPQRQAQGHFVHSTSICCDRGRSHDGEHHETLRE